MIALSSVFGKTFHQILASRTTDCLTENNFIDSSVQKAFIRGINGVIEHNQVLGEITCHAKRNNRTCHITFFDLEDAFGSVHHDLISHSLSRFHFPPAVKTYVENV